MTAYQALRAPRHEIRQVRGLDYHLTHWGPAPGASDVPVILLHGWQDTGDTFQFLVDAFRQDRPLVALDWRGFGRSGWSHNGYWFPDYHADLDALLDLLWPGVAVSLVGHSMGGNIASLYAGIRPERVRSVVNLEGFGMPRTTPDQAGSTLRRWLTEVKTVPPLKHYASFDQLAAIIAFKYPRFSAAQAGFVARVWAKADPDGRVRLLGDSRHRWSSPVLYRREETEAIWRDVRSPYLMLLGDESHLLTGLGADGTDVAFRTLVPHMQIAHIPGAGHMLHIEKPALVAPLVEDFLSTH